MSATIAKKMKAWASSKDGIKHDMNIAYVIKLGDIYYVTTTCGQDYSFYPRSAAEGDDPLLVRSHQTWMQWVADPDSGPCPAYIVLESDGQASLVFCSV